VIWLASAVLGLGGLAVLAAGLAAPVSLATDEPETAAVQPVAAAPSVDLARLKALAAVDLRRPLGADAAILGAGAALPIKLVGTINEADHSMALLQRSDNSVRVCGVGQTLDGPGGRVTVMKIERDRVTVQFGGRSYELAMPPPARPGVRP